MATTQTIPSATTERAATQAALIIVETEKTPFISGSLTIDKAPIGWNLVDAVSPTAFPDAVGSLEVWKRSDQGGQVQLQLGSRERISSVVSRIQRRLDARASNV